MPETRTFLIIGLVALLGLAAGCRKKPAPVELRHEMQQVFDAYLGPGAFDTDLVNVRTVPAFRGDPLQSAVVLGYTVQAAAGFYPDWAVHPAHFRAWAHELFHVYQYFRAGVPWWVTAWRFAHDGIRLMRTGDRWHDQELEREAIAFADFAFAWFVKKHARRE